MTVTITLSRHDFPDVADLRLFIDQAATRLQEAFPKSHFGFVIQGLPFDQPFNGTDQVRVDGVHPAGKTLGQCEDEIVEILLDVKLQQEGDRP